jgi:hypothetical protein
MWDPLDMWQLDSPKCVWPNHFDTYVWLGVEMSELIQELDVWPIEALALVRSMLNVLHFT